MAWWTEEDSLRFISLEFTGDTYGPNLRGLDTGKIVAATAGMQANVLVVFALGHGAIAYYPSRVFPHHPSLGRRNIIKELLNASRGRGIRLVCYNCAHNIFLDVLKDHPEWAIKPRSEEARPELKSVPVCINSPFQDCFVEAIQEVVGMGVDGMFFDGLGFCEMCVCAACRASFRRHMGGDLRKADASARRLWYEAVQQDLARRFHGAIKSLNPNCLYFVNGLGAGAGGELSDALGAEAFFGLRDRYLPPINDVETVGRMVNGCARPEQVRIVYSRYAQSPWAHHTNTDAELELATYRSIAAGVEPWYSAYDTGFFGYPEGMAAIARANTFVKKAGPYIRHDTATARVLLLEDELSWMEIDLWTHGFRGFSEALTTARIPWHAAGIDHVTSEQLFAYDLVVVPGLRQMTDRQVRLLAGYAAAGGRLILTGEAAFADKTGRPRKTLPAIWGYQPTAKNPYFGEKFVQFKLGGYIYPARGSRAVLGDMADRPVLPCVRYAPRVCATQGSRVLAWLEKRDTTSAYSRFEGPAKDPALLMNRRGNVIYAAANIDVTYRMNRNAVSLDLIRRLVEYFIGGGQALRTNAPESVEISIRRQPPEGRILIHMVNATSVAARPIRDIVPVHDIKVSVSGSRPKRVFSLRGAKVRMRRKPGHTIVELDRLDRYDIIVLETKTHRRIHAN